MSTIETKQPENAKFKARETSNGLVACKAIKIYSTDYERHFEGLERGPFIKRDNRTDSGVEITSKAARALGLNGSAQVILRGPSNDGYLALAVGYRRPEESAIIEWRVFWHDTLASKLVFCTYRIDKLGPHIGTGSTYKLIDNPNPNGPRKLARSFEGFAGYLVGVRSHENVSQSESTLERLVQFGTDFDSELVGWWHDAETGHVSFDLVEHVAENQLARAVALAFEHNQKAIYDCRLGISWKVLQTNEKLSSDSSKVYRSFRLGSALFELTWAVDRFGNETLLSDVLK